MSSRCFALSLALASATLTAPAPNATEVKSPGLIERILYGDARFAPLLKSPERYRLQIVLGLVEEDDSGRPCLVQHTYRAGAEYFYPASTVKLFAAVAALEELEELRRTTGLALDRDTPLIYHPLFADEVLESEDLSNQVGGKITVGHEIRKLFLVSDNVAYNRLYELVGPAKLNLSIARAGLSDVRIVHRLSEFRSVEGNRRAPKIEMLGEGFRYVIEERLDNYELTDVPVGGLDVGKGYMSDGELVHEPLDFRGKNRVPLTALQRALAMIVRPEIEAGGPGFLLRDKDREFLLEAMRQYPRESENPVYDAEKYPDHWVKFFLPGLRKVIDSDHLRIYNKIGQAYGFMIENSYVVDEETGRSFFLAATVYTNENGILNDDHYEYERVAEPLMAHLGEAVARALLK